MLGGGCNLGHRTRDWEHTIGESSCTMPSWKYVPSYLRDKWSGDQLIPWENILSQQPGWWGTIPSMGRLCPKLSPALCYQAQPIPIWYWLSLFPWNANPTNSPAVHNWFSWSEQVSEMAHQYLEHTAQVTKEFTDWSSGKTHCYEPGDWVWLSSKDTRVTQECRKLSHGYMADSRFSRESMR